MIKWKKNSFSYHTISKTGETKSWVQKDYALYLGGKTFINQYGVIYPLTINN